MIPGMEVDNLLHLDGSQGVISVPVLGNGKVNTCKGSGVNGDEIGGIFDSQSRKASTEWGGRVSTFMDRLAKDISKDMLQSSGI